MALPDIEIENASAETKQAIKEVVGFDVNDKLSAIVEPRTQALAQLLLINDSGEAELASASDINADVRYKSGIPVVQHWNPLITKATATLNAATYPTGSDTPMVFDTVVYDELGLIDAVNGKFICPLLSHPTNANASPDIQIDFSINTIAGVSDATYFEITLEREVVPDTWISLSPTVIRRFPNVPSFGVGLFGTILLNSELIGTNANTFNLRLVLSHDGTYDLTLTGFFSMSLINISPEYVLIV